MLKSFQCALPLLSLLAPSDKRDLIFSRHRNFHVKTLTCIYVANDGATVDICIFDFRWIL